MKIGITTIYPGNNNYGGMLQAYALVSAIKQLGYEDVEQIDFEYGKSPIYPSLLSRCKQYSIKQIIEKIIEILVSKKKSLTFNKIKKREEIFENFRNKLIPHSKRYTINQHYRIGQDYDVLITGSDQVWNPNVIRDIFLFDFAPSTSVKKIAYAASIARKELSTKEKDYMIPRILKFDRIGVREATGSDILSNEGIKNNVVLDPTLLLSIEDWRAIMSERLIKGRYVIVYSFSNCAAKDKIKKYYDSLGVATVIIPFVKMKYNSYDENNNLQKMWDVGPSEFLSLIYYADHIFTDSFHGTVFSILFHKSFSVFERTKNNRKTNMNSRITDLLNLLSIKNHIISNTDEFITPDIDYCIVDNKLNYLKSSSLLWLKQSIEMNI